MATADKLKPQRVGFYQYHDIILGKGNFATVFLAHHKAIGCDVALKVINVDEIEEDYVIRNLTREARILRDLHHPNIVRLYETVKSINLYCLSLELVRGQNLYQYMKKQDGTRISEKLARVFFYQMLSAVEHMHRLHIIHRDLKQENILVEFGHRIKIVDFGLSNIYYPCYQPRTHCGSVEYAAPELFRSQSAYGTAADLWSLGVVLYAMVVGKMPFAFNREKEGKEKSDPSISARRRELFIQRISKGLMQENWELMEDLSPDCWNLLHDLLQPDQFRRIRIKEAICHHWITKDVCLKKRLPQRRKDLQRKFQPEIVEFLADQLNTSVARIEKHVCARHDGKITCMFYIIRDTLIKDILYPPQNFKASFLYRFECWRQHRSSLYALELNPDTGNYYEYNVPTSETDAAEKVNVSQTSNKQSVVKGYLKTSIFSQYAKARGDLKSSSINETSNANVTNTEKLSKRTHRNIIISRRAGSDDVSVEQRSNQTEATHPYRSYKYSRPEKFRICPSSSTMACKLPDVKRKPNCSSTENTCEKLPSTIDQQLKSQHSYVKNNSPENYPKKIILRNEDPTKIKVQVSKASKSLDVDSIKPQKKSSASRSSVSESKNIVPPKKQVNTRTYRHTDARQNLSRKREGGITLLTRKQPANTPDTKGETEKMIPSEIPSRIPIKNMRYGPPAVFSQSFNSKNTPKSKKATVADRISFSGGDTNEPGFNQDEN